MKSTVLRVPMGSQVRLGGCSPFAVDEPPALERVPWGFPEIDALTGGLPRGGLTEIVGPVSTGRTSLGLSLLAQMTAREEVCAWVDASDSLDPGSAQARGADLRRLLWVRGLNLEQSFQAADLLLQSGGFGLVALDLGNIPPPALRRVPLSFWFRFRRAVEHTPTVLLLLEPEPSAKTCASLALELKLEATRWSTISTVAMGKHSGLLQGLRFRAKVLRSRLPRPPGTTSAASFQAKTPWSFRQHVRGSL